MTSIEIEKSKVDFTSLFKIKEINIDTVTLVKYSISKEMSIGNNDKINIILKDIIGTESHKATPDVITQLAGKTGEIIKSFTIEKIGKHGKIVKITKVIWI